MSINISKEEKGSYTLITELWSDGNQYITRSDGKELEDKGDIFDEITMLESRVVELLKQQVSEDLINEAVKLIDSGDIVFS